MPDVKVNRAAFLQKLEAVRPGLSLSEETNQSSSFAFRRGKVMAFNGDVYCRVKSGLPKDLRAAVQAAPLLEALRKLGDEEIAVEFTGNELVVHGKGRKKFGVSAISDVTMQVDVVDPPGEWQALHQDFLEAIKVANTCASQARTREFDKAACLHISPEFIEAAADCFQACRYTFDTGVSAPFLVRANSMKQVVDLGMTEMSESGEWLHFINPSEVILSCRRYDVTFPDLTEALNIRGKPAVLPKGLKDAAALAGVFSGEVRDNDVVNVKLGGGEVVVFGRGVTGWAEIPRKINYNGPDLEFSIAPDALAKLAENYNDVEIADRALRIDGGRWVMMIYLKNPVPTTNGATHANKNKDA